MLEMIRSLGDQLRWAANLDLPETGSHHEFVIAGMGGSGIAGDFVSAVTVDSAVRVEVHKDYGPLPGWVDRVEPLVLTISYSGNTEETLSVAADARSRSLPLLAITTGGTLVENAKDFLWPTVDIPSGLQPRAAVGYLFGSALRVVGAALGISGPGSDLDEAADVADEVTSEGSPGWKSAEKIANALKDKATIVYGGGPVSAAAALRWKTQINENAKMPAWRSVLPELDHNEVTGWETLPSLTKESLAIVALTDSSDHPRITERYRHTRDLTGGAVDWVDLVPSEGVSATARLISLVAVGDLVSWMLASNAGVDPVPVTTIEELKKLLIEDQK